MAGLLVVIVLKLTIFQTWWVSSKIGRKPKFFSCIISFFLLQLEDKSILSVDISWFFKNYLPRIFTIEAIFYNHFISIDHSHIGRHINITLWTTLEEMAMGLQTTHRWLGIIWPYRFILSPKKVKVLLYFNLRGTLCG